MRFRTRWIPGFGSGRAAGRGAGLAFGIALGLATGWVAGATQAQQDPARQESGAGEPPTGGAPSVDLDRLLNLPDTYDAGAAEEKRGGVSETEWRRRFSQARADLSEAEQKLDQIQLELENAAAEGGNYQVNAPGVQNPEASPVSFGLRTQLREQRTAVEERKRALRQLEIEADLADVPSRWRGAGAATKRSSGSRSSGLAPPETKP